MANNLPPAVSRADIADRLGVDDQNVESLLDKLQFDPAKHCIPVVRVLEDVIDEGDLDIDDLNGEVMEAIQRKVEVAIEESKLSDDERRDFAKYESQIKKSLRQSAEAFRQIKERRLYREDYPSWNDYVAARWQMSGSSADYQIAWLRMTELLEQSLGKDFRLSLTEARALLRLEQHPELAAKAILAAEEKAKAADRKRLTDDVKAEVERRLEYTRYDDVPSAMTLDEFEALRRLGLEVWQIRRVIEEVRERQSEGMSFDEAVEAVPEVQRISKEKKKREKKLRLASVRQEKKAKAEEEKKLTEEIKALESPPVANEGANGTETQAVEPVEPNEKEVPEEEVESEIYTILEEVGLLLEKALNSTEWDQEPLRKPILAKAEEVEKAVAALVAKAEMLAGNGGDELAVTQGAEEA